MIVLPEAAANALAPNSSPINPGEKTIMLAAAMPKLRLNSLTHFSLSMFSYPQFILFRYYLKVFHITIDESFKLNRFSNIKANIGKIIL
jgi:hypothetical protein